MQTTTNTSVSHTYALKGGYRDQSLIRFEVCKETNTVRILHFSDYSTKSTWYEPVIYMRVDEDDVKILCHLQYSIEFARKVWNTFVNLQENRPKDSTYRYHKFVPYAIPVTVDPPTPRTYA